MEFIKNRLKSLQYVFQGVYYLVKNEPPVIVHILTSLAWVILGFYFQITTNEWIIQLLCIGIVLSVEGFNICDFVHTEHHKTIGIIKDIAAGSVAFAVIPATIVLGIIYYPYVLTLFF